MPRIARRVVCGFSLVIAIFSPTSALVSVDFPTFGRPTKVTNPLRVVSIILSILFFIVLDWFRCALDEHRRDPSATTA